MQNKLTDCLGENCCGESPRIDLNMSRGDRFTIEFLFNILAVCFEREIEKDLFTQHHVCRLSMYDYVI